MIQDGPAAIDRPDTTGGSKLVVRANASKDSLRQILEELSEEDARQVLSFAEFLKLRQERWFVEYVNQRTDEALTARQAGKKFTSLAELQRELG
jgi:hypothetical protein